MTAVFSRGICPTFTAPIPSGDGLLARMMVVDTIAIDTFSGLCAAARAHGNGVIEITARGNIQVRGLTQESAPRFADAVRALDISVAEGIPVMVGPLAGLDPQEVVGSDVLAATVRGALGQKSHRVAPKTSILIDGGGALHLDALAADMRLCAIGDWLHVAVGGDGTTATFLGAVTHAHATEVVVRILALLADRGPTSRARDVIKREGEYPFRLAIADLLVEAPAPVARLAAEPVGTYALRDDHFAVGIGLPFGYTEVTVLEQLVDAAYRSGAVGMRPAFGRVLFIVGVRVDAVTSLAIEAARLGFVVDAGDPRRRVIACPGAPICSSAQIPARALAPAIADAVAAQPGIIHVSGCKKGCAYRGPAAITIVGRDGSCDVFVDGVPVGTATVETLEHSIMHLVACLATAHD